MSRPRLSRTCYAALTLATLCMASSVHAEPEPAVQRTVVEDDGVRIDETRVRGQVTRVVVRSKIAGARPYEILTGDAARDPTQERRAIGQRVWHILSF